MPVTFTRFGPPGEYWGSIFLAEEQRRGAFVGLAIASAFVVLVASGVAVSRLGSDRSGRVPSDVASPGTDSGSGPASGATATGEGAAVGSAGTSGALSASAPVPPPVPASGTARVRTGRSTKGPAKGSPVSTGDRAAGGTGSSAAMPGASGGAASGSNATPDGSEGGEASPDPKATPPDSESLAAASASVGEGDGGAVAGVGLGQQPDVDLTLGSNPLVGDAPPSHGTGIGLGGRFLNPPPTIPILPG